MKDLCFMADNDNAAAEAQLAEAAQQPHAEVISPTGEVIKKQAFEIDDDNFIDNGETFFHIDDIKNIVSSNHPQQPAIPVIVFNFVGYNLMMPFGTREVRDAIFSEVRTRMRHIKKNTIHIYISGLKKARAHAEKEKAA
jgi:hypothetical protein